MLKRIWNSIQTVALMVFISLGFIIVSAADGFATIQTFYSDKGIPAGTSVFTWPTPPAGATFNGVDTTLATVPEGLNSFRTKGPGFAGWGIFYPSGINLSSFASGEIRFWLYTNSSNLKFEIEYLSHTKLTWNFNGVIPSSLFNTWVLVRIPLNTVTTGLTNVYSPFEFTANVGATFYIDDVRYVNSTVSPIFNVSLHNASDNSPAAQISWAPSVTPGTWARANQYLQLDLDPDNTTWGVQIYTNNKAGGANPLFSTTAPTGQPGSNPAGIISTADHSMAVPVAWSIKAATSTFIPVGSTTPIVSPPPPADPNNHADPNSFEWLFMKDRNTPSIPLENTTAFADGQIDLQVKSNVGIHFGQNPAEIGAENSPNYIYFESKFPLAATTYQTSTITVEYYYP